MNSFKVSLFLCTLIFSISYVAEAQNATLPVNFPELNQVFVNFRAFTTCQQNCSQNQVIGDATFNDDICYQQLSSFNTCLITNPECVLYMETFNSFKDLFPTNDFAGATSNLNNQREGFRACTNKCIIITSISPTTCPQIYNYALCRTNC